MGTLLSVLFIALLFCGSFPYWVFAIAALAYFQIRKRELAHKDEEHLTSTALFVGAVSAITSLSYGIHVSASQTSCIICGTPGGIYRGWPLGWFGRGGADLIVAPFYLGLDIVAWFLISVLFLNLILEINRRFQYPEPRIAISFACIIVMLIPFSFSTPPVIQATNWVNQQIETYNKQQEIRRQQEFDKRVRLGVETFNNAIQFQTCQDHLVPSSKVAGGHDLLVEVMVDVNLENNYYFFAGTDDTGYSTLSDRRQSLTAGEHELSFLFDMVHRANGLSSLDGHTYVNGWESNVLKPGPYAITIQLYEIDDGNGQAFGYYEAERARQLGLINETKVSITCITQPYRIEDFGIPKGVVPEP